MTYGEYRRTKPRLNILRGWAGNEPQSLTFSAKPKLNVNIYSGQLIIPDPTDSTQWILCDSDEVTHKNVVPYFAYSDAIWVNGRLQTDTDVGSSGLLLGLSCLGDFEIQTAYFDTNDTWKNGDPVIKSATAGSVDQGASFLSAVETIGVVTRGGMEDIAKINSEATPDNTGKVYMLNIALHWKPAQS